MQKRPTFQLRFDSSDVRFYADRYSFRQPDSVAEGAGSGALEVGYYTRRDFLTICRWKSPRTERLWSDESNSLDHVREVTGIALSTGDERLRIEVLTLLRGVKWPTASVLLHFATEPERPDRGYPILDFRALWSVGIDKPPSVYMFEFWRSYTAYTRRLADMVGVTMRELDRALWQFSKENQPTALGLYTTSKGAKAA